MYSAVFSTLSALFAFNLTSISPSLASQQDPPRHDPPVEVAASRTYFYVGGQYVSDGRNGTILQGQMYVEHLRPSLSRHEIPSNQTQQQRHPFVLIHGAAQTGNNWLNTPDGREGWASYFLRQGHEVYIVDQPQRGRSQYAPADPTCDSDLILFSAEQAEMQFTAPERFNRWPQAKLHTQWPGSGIKGDPIFDAFYASQVQFDNNDTRISTYMQRAGAALLDRIGPSIVVTHSQAGTFGFLIADARPSLVKLLVSLEPRGPPFYDGFSGPPGTFARPWALSAIPLTYDPPVRDPAADLPRVDVPAPNADLTGCSLQRDPARKLPNLARMPHLVVTSEASYHARYDYCTVDYLKQAGVGHVEHFQLQDAGLHGNAHFMFMEKNSLQVAEAMYERIQRLV